MLSQVTPLDGHPAFRVSRFDALEDAVATQLSAKIVELPSKPETLDARANRFALPNSSLWFCAYSVPVALRFPEPDHVRVQFHHAGVGATWIGETFAPVTRSQGCISSTAAEFDFSSDFQQVVWRISKDCLRRKLAGLTDAPLSGDLWFDHKLDLEKPQGQLLSKLLACTLHAAETVGGESGGIVLAELEQAMISAFLAGSEHRWRDRLEGRVVASAAPWQVRRAEAYIAANWDKPLEIDTVAEVTGASVRSIFRAFKQSRGYTPFEFAKRIRLSQARRMLEEAGAGGSVTNVCFACGFSDLGRFSKDFALAFGERPSDVLKRRKDGTAALH